MLRADVVVVQAVGFVRGELQRVLGIGAERHFNGRVDFLAAGEARFEVPSKVHRRDLEPGENPRDDRLFPRVTQQADEDVFRPDRRGPELGDRVPREEQRPPCRFRVAVEHGPAGYDRTARAGPQGTRQ